VKKIIMIALLAAIAVRGGTGTLTFDWIHADTAAALSAGTDRDRLDAAITNEVDPVAMEALSGYATTGELAIATANLDETDPRAMRAYHYGDPDIQITPAGDFGFDATSGEITSYTGTNKVVVLPYEINGVPVVALGNSAFAANNVVKTIKASKTLTTLGEYAFSYSSLTSLDAPALTTLSNFAFAYSSLTSLVAPSLTTISNFAFAYSSLTSLVAPSLTTIGAEAFSECPLTNLNAPSLTSIGDNAFSYSVLTSIYYGGNQPTAGANIYYGTPTNLVSYVTNPTATGWGNTFGDRPVVRLPLYADEVYSGGSLAVTEATKELHQDSYTNLVWRNVFSNGWVWLVAYTNTPGGGQL